MGYDLHITRKTDWFDEEGPEISREEWDALRKSDPELSIPADVAPADPQMWATFEKYEGAFYWNRGEITSKDPERSVIVKMVALAHALGAQVQGDDGEVYGDDGAAKPEERGPSAKEPGILKRISSWYRRCRSARQLRAAAPKFQLGARVRNPWGVRGTVIEIDMKAEGGLGVLVVRTDSGAEDRSAYIASAWELDTVAGGD